MLYSWEGSISHSIQRNLKLSTYYTFCPNYECAVYAEVPLYTPSQSVVQRWNGFSIWFLPQLFEPCWSISGYNRPLANISLIKSICLPVSLHKTACTPTWHLYKNSNFYFYWKFEINSDCGWNERRVGHITLGSTYISYITTSWLFFFK